MEQETAAGDSDLLNRVVQRNRASHCSLPKKEQPHTELLACAGSLWTISDSQIRLISAVSSSNISGVVVSSFARRFLCSASTSSATFHSSPTFRGAMQSYSSLSLSPRSCKFGEAPNFVSSATVHMVDLDTSVSSFSCLSTSTPYYCSRH